MWLEGHVHGIFKSWSSYLVGMTDSCVLLQTLTIDVNSVKMGEVKEI